MKNNLSYYTHKVNSHHHWKFKTLRRKYGWAGEGRFWALNNMIAESDHCRLNIADESRLDAIAADLDLSAAELTAFISYLSATCKLVVQDKGFIMTGITQENLEKVDGKRTYQREWTRSKSNIETGNSSIETTGSSIETKKSNIENEQSKVKKNKIKKREQPPPSSFGSVISKSIVDLMTDCLADKIYFVEHVCRQHRISEYQVNKALEDFNSHLLSIGEGVKTVKDYRQHFQNWLPKQDMKKFRLNPQEQRASNGVNDTLNSIGL